MRRSSATRRSSSSRRISACANDSSREVGERRAAPESERLTEEPCCGRSARRLCRLLDEPLEAEQVELVGLDPDQVAGLPGDDRVARRRAALRSWETWYCSAFAAASGGSCAPQLVDQPVGETRPRSRE